jgi:acyl-CoA thioesterase FadM
MPELPLYRATIEPDWIDYNGHVRDAYYALVASYAVDELMDPIGIDAAYRSRTHCTLYTIEMHAHYLLEVKSTDALSVQSSILGADRKRLHVGCRFAVARLAAPVASFEFMLIHVRQGEQPASIPFPPAVTARIDEFRASPAACEAFGPVSRKIELQRR